MFRQWARKFLKQSEGSIIVTVISAMIMFLTVTTVTYTGVMQKSTAQKKEVKKIEQEYEKEAEEPRLREIYEEVAQKVNVIQIELRRLSGEIINPDTDWTNENLTMKVILAGGTIDDDSNIVLKINGTEKEYTPNCEITDACTITVEYKGITKTVDAKKFDRIKPTILFEPDGEGKNVNVDGTAPSEFSTKLTASDEGGSGLAILQYAWSTSKTGTTAATVNTATTTYYAVYKKTVTATKYVHNNQSSTAQGTAYGYSDGTTANATIALGTTALSGYTFRGWSTSNTANAGITVNANGNASIINNTTYYASYTYNITTSFNTNGGGTAPSAKASTGYMNYKGDKVGDPITLPTLTRADYLFNGWYTAASSGTTVGNAGASYTPTASATLYAQWTAANYSVNTSPVTYTVTLAEAVAAANSGSTITVLKDNTDSSAVTINKNVTLNTGSKTLTRTAEVVVNASRTLTVSGTGTIIAGSSNTIKLDGGNVVVASGIVKATGNTNKAIYNVGEGNITLIGGTITSTDGEAICNYAEGSVTVSGGMITSTSSVAIHNKVEGSVTVSGGTITSSTYAIGNEGAGTITVSGGTVEGTGASYPTIVNSTASTGRIEIRTGATIKGGVWNINTGSVTVSGGTITSSTHAIRNDGAGTITVSGGTVEGTEVYPTIVNDETSTGRIEIKTGATIKGVGTAVWNRNTGSVTVSGGTITSTNSTGISNNGTGNITITGGSIMSTNNRGVYSNTTATVTIGNASAAISTTSPLISGGTSGVYVFSAGTFNFYNGMIRGKSESYYGLDNKRSNATLVEDTADGYKRAYFR